MKRFITDSLIAWKNSKTRKPLILKGARQVGKTYILKEFGEKYYHDMVYFNFDHDEGLSDLFKNTKDPKRIIEQLALASGKKIVPNDTLIFFDEIQECPNALNSLKYFCEEVPEYHIVCAGSLLGIRLSRTSFPVGKVDFLQLYPLSFSEFLIADHCENLVEYMSHLDQIEPIPSLFESQLIEKLKTYFIIGGMPEAVYSWVNEKDIEKVNYIQDNILQAYESDFSKHTTNSEANKISLIWNGIPSQLAKENKKFVYQAIKPGARAREYEDALNWLNDANLIYKTYNVTKPVFPLTAYHDLSSFKVYLNDVGLLRRMSRLDSRIILEGHKLFEEFKGSFTENYVFTMLNNFYDGIPNYYTFDRYEIDFLLQYHNQIIPVEVKSGKSHNHISLTKFHEKYNNEISICFSLDNLKKDGNIVNIPLYLVEYLDQILK
ncbi:MAG TPA: ATP-binding protein [Candidatus Pelethosoma merdigallinarum]|nr:ATP-binding protein [Candidatus Pelethosoma merdigallinarum]